MSASAVVWDMGGIIYRTPFEVFGDVEAERALAPGTLPRGPFDPRGDAEYLAVDGGRLPEPEYWRRAQERWQAAGVAFDVHRDIAWAGRERPEVVEALALLAARGPQAVLTNDATSFLGAHWHRTWPHARHFSHLLDSVELGVRKPAPEAYRAVVSALGLAPQECLFVDDLTVNVEASFAAGMPAVRFDVTDPVGSVAAVLAAVDHPPR